MKYNTETRPNGVSSITGEVLTEAMPWIKNVTGKTVVIKYGGSAMEDAELRAEVMADIVLLKIIGVNPVIVHGGGKAISRAMEQFGMPVEFVDGQRVTSDEAMGLVRMVLTGEVNQELVEAMNQHGNMAVGVSGTDAGVIVAHQASERLGRVGEITDINSALISDLVAADYPGHRLDRHRRGRRLLQRERRRGGGSYRRGHRGPQDHIPHRCRRPV